MDRMSPQQKIDTLSATSNARMGEIADYFYKRQVEFGKALPKNGMVPQQFLRVFLTTVQRGTNLSQCSIRSLAISAYEAASLGLAVDGVLGHAYLVPRRVKGVWTANLEIGYRGFCELAYRSDRIAFIEAHAIRDNDEFDFEHGTKGFVKYKRPMTGELGELTKGAYAMAHLNGWDGPPFFRYLRTDEVLKRRDCSSAWRSAVKYNNTKDSIWVIHEEAMFRKTAIRALSSTLPQNPTLQRVAIADEIREEGKSASYTDGAVEMPELPEDGPDAMDATYEEEV